MARGAPGEPAHPTGPRRFGSTFEHLQLGFDRLPLVRIGRRRLALDDRLPELRELGVERGELLLVRGHIVFSIDGLDRTLGYAQCAVDALVRIYHQKIGSFAEAVHWTDIDAV